MSNERYDDEVLSAIIDDEADAELVASVRNDSDASLRLEHMRQAVQLVAEEPAPATAERRSASIAAALAAATPAPEVTSLAAARHEKKQAEKKRNIPTWAAAVAAAVAFVVAIPIAISLGLGGGESTDTATATDSAGDSASLDVGETSDFGGAEAMADSADDVVEEAMEEEAMEESDEAMEDDAMEEPAEAMEEEGEGVRSTVVEAEAPAAIGDEAIAQALTTRQLRNRANLVSVNNLDNLESLIDLSIRPRYSAEQMESANVSPECLQASQDVTSDTPYDLVNLTPFGGEDRLILVEFADDGSTRVLDAEDCAPLR